MDKYSLLCLLFLLISIAESFVLKQTLHEKSSFDEGETATKLLSDYRKLLDQIVVEADETVEPALVSIDGRILKIKTQERTLTAKEYDPEYESVVVLSSWEICQLKERLP